jgi:GAF domain-containing protein
MFDVISQLAKMTVDTDQPEQTLLRVTELARRALGGIQDVSLTMVDDDRPRSVVSTGQLAIDLDQRQYDLGSGPCIDAAKTGDAIVVDTHDDNSPYREFGRIAAEAGVRYTVSVGMPLTQHNLGGLNMYQTAAEPFPLSFLEQARIFADYAAVVVNNVLSYATAVNQAAQLRAAMDSRAGIEQAKGILMARHHCSADEAFDRLRRASQERNVKLREIAHTIVVESVNG